MEKSIIDTFKLGGCNSKISFEFTKMIQSFSFNSNKGKENAVFENFSDFGSIILQDNKHLTQSLDFFPIFIDNPYLFGKISIIHSLSDIYVTNSTPISALNILTIPQHINRKFIFEIIEGSLSILNKENIPLIGGHTIFGDNLLYGFSVTGIKEDDLFNNFGAKENDLLILTKPLGLNPRQIIESDNQSTKDEIINQMLLLNKIEKNIFKNYSINSITDVTGFGLIGQCYIISQNSKVSIELFKNIPSISNLKKFECEKNREFKNYVANNDKIDNQLLFEPQTSGGLLISLPENQAFKLLIELKNFGFSYSNIIGRIVKKRDFNIYIL